MKKILLLSFITLFTYSRTNAQSLPFVDTSLNDSLVAYYNFNGNANDISNNGNHGLINGAILTNDRFGNSSAYEFNNSSIVIENEMFDNSWDYYTLSFWFLINNTSQHNQTLFNTNPHVFTGIGFNHNLSGLGIEGKIAHWKSEMGDSWNTFPNGNPFLENIIEDTWCHITLVRNDLEYYYYVDGILNKTTSINPGNYHYSWVL